MTPEKIKQFWLSIATFNLADHRDHELFSKLIADAFKAKDGTTTYKLALIMIKGMQDKAPPSSLDAFLGAVIQLLPPTQQMHFINQVTVASQLVISIEKCEALSSVIHARPVVKSTTRISPLQTPRFAAH